MSINPLDYYQPQDWAKIYAEAAKHQTPFIIVSLDVIKQKYEDLRRQFPYTKIYYAVKSNPAEPVVTLLRDLGSNFDIASIYELDDLLRWGVDPSRISYGNTIKKASEIQYAYEKGVRLFATDSLGDVQNLSKFAPGSQVFFRILVEGAATSQWPLSRKFGCHLDMVISEIIFAKNLGLKPRGVSFHVGSQQLDTEVWNSAIAKVRSIFDCLEEEGIKMDLINMGGGLPAQYVTKIHQMDVYSNEIARFLRDYFGDQQPEVFIEPGRAMVAEAGVLVSETIQVCSKSDQSLDKWLFTDASVFNGLIETVGECIKYPVYCEAEGDDAENFIVAGPTCDSMDVMYEDYRVPLPNNITVGDRLYWFSTGAYTSSYCAVGFNGFPPLKTYYV